MSDYARVCFARDFVYEPPRNRILPRWVRALWLRMLEGGGNTQ